MAKVDIKVSELVEKVKRSDLMLPEMQRKYVWPATRVRDLLDSLYRNYPSGTILVWETDENIDTRELSVNAIQSNPTNSNRLLLLDGQQRLTSLTAILSGEPIMVRNRKRPVEILFNLEHPEGPPVEVMEVDEEDIAVDYDQVVSADVAQKDIQEELKKRTFVVASSRLKNDPLWVSVSDIFSQTDSELLRPIGINSDDPRWDKYSKRIGDVRAIKDYQYVMHVLEKSMAYEEVTEIFVRVNSLGAKLRSSDLALAQITSKWRGFTDELNEFCKQFGDDAEYIEDWVALRMLTVFATKQSKYKTIGKYSKQQLQAAWEQAKDAIHYSINFLRNNAGVESMSHLSASMLLVPIGVYSVLNDGKLSGVDEKKILKWFYYAHMRGHYGMGSSETILNVDLSTLFRGGSLDKLLEVLFEHVKRFEVSPQDILGKNTASPFFTMVYMIFSSKNVKDWRSGISISAKSTGVGHAIQYHHIFPKSLLQKRGLDTKDINEIANLAFISGKLNREISNKEPNDYFEKYKENSSLINEQLIPIENKSLLKLENYYDFLDYRRKALADMINEFIASKTQ